MSIWTCRLDGLNHSSDSLPGQPGSRALADFPAEPGRIASAQATAVCARLSADECMF